MAFRVYSPKSGKIMVEVELPSRVTALELRVARTIDVEAKYGGYVFVVEFKASHQYPDVDVRVYDYETMRLLAEREGLRYVTGRIYTEATTWDAVELNHVAGERLTLRVYSDYPLGFIERDEGVELESYEYWEPWMEERG